MSVLLKMMNGEIQKFPAKADSLSINYVSRIVNVYFSTCSTKENFCKFDGIRYAEELGVERSIDLDQFQKFANNDNVRGFVSAYISIIRATRTLDGNSHREDELLKKLDKVTTYLNLKN